MDEKTSNIKLSSKSTKLSEKKINISDDNCELKRSKSKIYKHSEVSSTDSDHKDDNHKSDLKLVKTLDDSSKHEKEKKMGAALKIAESISHDFSEDDSEIKEFTKRSPSPLNPGLKSQTHKIAKDLLDREDKNIDNKTTARSLSRAGMMKLLLQTI